MTDGKQRKIHVETPYLSIYSGRLTSNKLIYKYYYFVYVSIITFRRIDKCYESG